VKPGDNAVVAFPPGVDRMAASPPLQTPTPPTPAEPSSSVAAVGATGPLVGPFQLFLEASEQAWVMYSFDDGDPIDAMLYAGDKISIHATRRITLKLGNAGGVAGTLNGRRLPPFGERGQVRNFTYGQ
jgi:cytoskeleton protein RodZ